MTRTHRQNTDEASESASTTRRLFVKGALGTVATAFAVSETAGVAAAHFPLQLDIDVQPENADNFVDLSKHDTVRTAVHRTEFLNSDGDREVFNPTDEGVRYRFGSRSALEKGGGARPADGGTVSAGGGDHGDEEDSQDTLLLNFPVGETGLEDGMETAWLSGSATSRASTDSRA